jgi:hypothetical protein
MMETSDVLLQATLWARGWAAQVQTQDVEADHTHPPRKDQRHPQTRADDDQQHQGQCGMPRVRTQMVPNEIMNTPAILMA